MDNKIKQQPDSWLSKTYAETVLVYCITVDSEVHVLFYKLAYVECGTSVNLFYNKYEAHMLI